MSVDPRLGSEEDLRSLIDIAHKNGLQFIMDLPLTVLSSKAVGGNLATVGQTASGNQPALLNVDDEGVQNRLVEAAKKWLKMGVDGLCLADYGIGSKVIMIMIISNMQHHLLKEVNLRNKKTKALTVWRFLHEFQSVNHQATFFKLPPSLVKPPTELVQRLRQVVADDLQIPQRDVLIFTDTGTVANTSYQLQSVVPQNPHAFGPGSFLDLVQKSIDQGVGVARDSNGTVRPLWQLSALANGPRVDQQLDAIPSGGASSMDNRYCLNRNKKD
jgi:hypothetical protein